jgi:pyrroloquinoline quinone biosynthesis protein E
VLPCHAAESITSLSFDNVRQRGLGEIWRNSEAFQAFRGTDWMPEPCRSCDRKELDWGGCRCQAFAITGDAARTDPACALSSDHELLVAIAEREAGGTVEPFIYRRYRNAVVRELP